MEEKMITPADPKIYHIIHIDKMPSVIDAGGLRCDADVARKKLPGTIIGMGNIKARRLATPLGSYPDLHVGDCVPFYFCPRSVMLYMIYKANAPDLPYRGGQSPIVHLCARFNEAIAWAGETWKTLGLHHLKCGFFLF